MRPIFGLSVVTKQQQQQQPKYIDTDEDDHDSMFNDLPKKGQHSGSNGDDEDEEEYGEDED